MIEFWRTEEASVAAYNENKTRPGGRVFRWDRFHSETKRNSLLHDGARHFRGRAPIKDRLIAQAVKPNTRPGVAIATAHRHQPHMYPAAMSCHDQIASDEIIFPRHGNWTD